MVDTLDLRTGSTSTPALDLRTPAPPLDLRGQGKPLVTKKPDDLHNAYQTLLQHVSVSSIIGSGMGADFIKNLPEGLSHLGEDVEEQRADVQESESQAIGHFANAGSTAPLYDKEGDVARPGPLHEIVRGVGDMALAAVQTMWPSGELKSAVSRPLAATLGTPLNATDVAVNLAPLGPGAVRAVRKIPTLLSAIKSAVTGADKLKVMADSVGEVMNPQYANPEREKAAAAIAGPSSDYKRAQNILTAHVITDDVINTFSKMPDEANLGIISAIQHGEEVSDESVRPLVQTLRGVLDDRASQLVKFGALNRKNYIEHYFPNMFEDQDAAKRFIEQSSSKMEQNPSFLRQRNYDFFEDGLAAGLKPVTTNPALITLIRARQVDQYVQRLKILKNMKDMGFVRYIAYGDDTAGFTPLEDSAFGHAFEDEVPKQKLPKGPKPVTIKDANSKTVIPRRRALEETFKDVEALIKRHGDSPAYAIHRQVSPQEWLPYRVLKDHYDELSPATKKVLGRIPNAKITTSKLKGLAQELDNIGTQEKRASLGRVFANARIKPAEETGAGRWMIQDDARRLADRHFSAGLFERTDWIGGGAAVLGGTAGGILKGAAVGTLIHPGMGTAVGGLVGGVLGGGARGLRMINNGLSQVQLGFSLFHPRFIFFDTSISATATGVERVVRGNFLGAAKSLAAGISHTVLPKRVMEGAILKKRYMGQDLGVIAKAFGYKNSEVDDILGHVLKGDYAPVRPDVYSNHVLNWREYWKQGKRLKGAAGSLSNAIDTLSYPVFGWLVPNAKTGVVYNMAQDWLKSNPEASFVETSTAMRRIIDSVDNRLGEMDLDRRFWHKTVKDVMLLSQRAVGWNFGTVDEIGGGSKELGDFVATGRMSHKLAYTLALSLHTALYGSVLTYLATGEGPKELKDYFFPPDGHGNRISLPTYAKDVYEWTHRPGQTAVHKIAPSLELGAEMYQNLDFYGAFIVDPRLDIPGSGRDDIRATSQVFKYLGDFIEPFGIQAYERKGEGDKSPLGYLESPQFRGSMPAPSWINDTPQQAAAKEIKHNRKALKQEYLEGRGP